MIRCLLLIAALLPLDNRELMRTFAAMVLRAHTLRGSEVAAFVVRERDGSLQCRMWPNSGRWESQQFTGAVPPNTVAIVHTHPEDGSAEPSPTDIATAKHLHVLVYVVKRYEIYAAEPEAGEILRIVRAHEWVRDAYRTPSIGVRPSAPSIVTSTIAIAQIPSPLPMNPR